MHFLDLTEHGKLIQWVETKPIGEASHAQQVRILRPRSQRRLEILFNHLPQQGDRPKDQGKKRVSDLPLLWRKVLSVPFRNQEGRQILFSALCKRLHQRAWAARQEGCQQGVPELRERFYYFAVLAKKVRKRRAILQHGLCP